MSETLVYLDHAAATPVLPEVAARHADLCRTYFANPHGTSRQSGQCHRAALRAEQELLSLLGIPPGDAEVVWTSGGTEACNLACLGFLRGRNRATVGVAATAHHAMLDPCRQFARHEGGHTFELPVRQDGSLDLEAAERVLPRDTDLLAVCHVNNETGVRHDLQELRRWMRTVVPKSRLAVDAMQSVGKLPLPWREGGIDLLVVGGRKLGGPAGVGALVLRRGVELTPLLYGGGQQRGLRPGTVDVVGILEFVQAVGLTVQRRQETLARIAELNRALRGRLQEDGRFPCQVLSPESASPYILSFTLPGFEGAVLMRAMAERSVVVATGSACTAESPDISHVMKAMGIDERRARGVLRVSFGQASSQADLDRFLDVLAATLQDY